MPGSLTPENCFQPGLGEKLLQEAKLSTTDAVLREQTSAVKRTMARDTFVDLRRTPSLYSRKISKVDYGEESGNGVGTNR